MHYGWTRLWHNLRHRYIIKSFNYLVCEVGYKLAVLVVHLNWSIWHKFWTTLFYSATDERRWNRLIVLDPASLESESKATILSLFFRPAGSCRSGMSLWNEVVRFMHMNCFHTSLKRGACSKWTKALNSAHLNEGSQTVGGKTFGITVMCNCPSELQANSNFHQSVTCEGGGLRGEECVRRQK